MPVLQKQKPKKKEKTHLYKLSTVNENIETMNLKSGILLDDCEGGNGTGKLHDFIIISKIK